MDNNSIAIEIIFNYLNNPSKYTKSYVQENFKNAISILEKKLEDYFEYDQNIKTETLGQESITYNNQSMEDLIKDVRVLLPNPKAKVGVLMC
ncbi:hypothetical protein [Clostridium sardiniense]|uniref:hypothetical protein n=1 Tax=Clostridium sardiniense TaxID=29369 RepID=UPI0019564C5B|nr:hypothetical protein [Clostridium sardiniense]MBM7836437.1 ribonucleotide reductase beta subunit family protein with ferritin-like domain [Clostridium sardiniense]